MLYEVITPKVVGRPLREIAGNDADAVIEDIRSAKSYVTISDTSPMVEVGAPIALGRTGTPWSIRIMVDRQLVFADAVALNKVMAEDANTNAIIAVSAALLAMSNLGLTTPATTGPGW